ncbi:MAG: RNA-binding transcriptional accessory protein [Oscillospiraceae bacterium]|nr:RNA-binding transcriptional accessory protein [Oscillospiraceae bacterium]
MDKNEANIVKILCEELNIKNWQAENVIGLIDDGNTIPFIARYRKEVTGALDDAALREFDKRLSYLRSLAEKRSDIHRLISEQNKMTPEIAEAIENALTLTELDDIYRPYKPKRRTRASAAREKGLLPLALTIMRQDKNGKSPEEEAALYINEEKGVNSIEEALNGAMDIIAEEISDNADFRKKLRAITQERGYAAVKGAKDEDSVYSMYYDFSEKLETLPPHRLLAINRGEKEGYLSFKLDIDEDMMIRYLIRNTTPKYEAPCTKYVKLAAEDAYKRLIAPSLANEIRSSATDAAEESSIKIFNKNLKGLLMQPPVKDRVVMGFDPGYRTGCKIAVVNGTGKVLDTGVIYCTLPNHDKDKAAKILKDMIVRNEVDIISIGNGTASKESEIFVSDLIKTIGRDVRYIMTNEAGASVYSASELASEEFPEYDVALRSAVSIARRLQDPLAELVKIDPKSIGVGQYQHDMNQKRLGEALNGVVEDCVNSVGVDLNTASPSLLSYVSGINKTVAKNITLYREANGKFTSRKQLLKVPKLGTKAFEQCAGFLRISDGTNFLDNTSVHPESYNAAEKLIEKLGYTAEDVKNGEIQEIKSRARKFGIKELGDALGVGALTLSDIIDSLLKPGRDPRDELPQPVLRSDILSIEDLRPDMVLDGVVRNVIDFGAFIDIGVHQDGLVHISQICDRYIKHPTDVLSVGDNIKVKILDIDIKKNRISLTMKNV